jgi:tetratricopeptide (TPR) repeat protein
MTAHRDLKRIVRDRQEKTGESYTAARAHVMRERAVLLGLEPEGSPAPARPAREDAVILRVNRQSARVQILGEEGHVTFRSGDVWRVVPGHVVTLDIARRWTWRGNAYANGTIADPRIDVALLGLEPLPLEDGELDDAAASYEPYRHPDPYAPLWQKLTAKPRPSFEFHEIAWGALPGLDEDANPTFAAAELMASGDRKGAQELLMEALATDLRCLDAHAHLGVLEFHHAPERAILHYEIGVRIGELSLPAGTDVFLTWGRTCNRPFLRCLHGYGLCLWRLGRLPEAQRVFERILSLNPNDNQGVRLCWHDVRNGRTWEEMDERERAAGHTVGAEG